MLAAETEPVKKYSMFDATVLAAVPPPVATCAKKPGRTSANCVVPASGCVASPNGTTEVLYSPATGATGNSSFRYVPPFQFNWDTSTASSAPIVTGKGCYTVLLTLSDQSAVRMTNGVQLK